MSIMFSTNVTAIDAVTQTTTSAAIDVSKRQQVTVQFLAASITSGHAVFTIDGSNNGTNWVTGIAFLDATQTTVGTFVVSKTLNSASTGGGYVTPGWQYIRVVCTYTTDGTYSAFIQSGG